MNSVQYPVDKLMITNDYNGFILNNIGEYHNPLKESLLTNPQRKALTQKWSVL